MTKFRYASVSLITNSSKDAILKVLSNDKVNLKLPLQEKATIKVSENTLKMLKEEDNFSSMDETIII
jgi:hypothetical protein